MTHQQKKVNTKNAVPIFYEDDKLSAARELFMSRFYPHAPEVPLNGPIRLITKWFYPTNNKRIKDGQWKTTRPDTDNLVKLPKDCLTKLGFWQDDSLVVSELIEKFWVTTSPSGVYVYIRNIKYQK